MLWSDIERFSVGLDDPVPGVANPGVAAFVKLQTGEMLPLRGLTVSGASALASARLRHAAKLAPIISALNTRLGDARQENASLSGARGALD